MDNIKYIMHLKILDELSSVFLYIEVTPEDDTGA
jgi:hypothetical protein